MQFHLRQNFFSDGKDTGIRNDQSIGADLLQFFKILTNAIQILIMSQNIGSHVHFHPILMGKSNAGRHIFHGKILGLGTQAESLTADIYCVSAIDYGGL